LNQEKHSQKVESKNNQVQISNREKSSQLFWVKK